MNMEIHYTIDTQDEINNTVGKILCLPETIDTLVIEVEVWASQGYAGTYWQPEELPNMEIENYVITKIYNEHGHGLNITPKQSALIEHLIDNNWLEDLCWDCLEANQEDVGDY